MRVLVVGGGGREHALCWKLRQSPKLSELVCAPGNGGIARIAECVPVAADDVSRLVDLARDRRIDLTVIGPEAPLTLGLADELERAGLRAFGPSREAAALEGSKAFTKRLLLEEGIPTAKAREFDDPEAAEAYVREIGAPVVVKADGLAAGKGVRVCGREPEAFSAIDEMLRQEAFGEAGRRIIVEEFLDGEEASFIAVTDGETLLPFASSQDHKRVFDGDRGPNTGGMGAVSPASVVTPEVEERTRREILEPVLRGLARRGIRFRGVLYAGLMIQEGAPKVLEFNVRFGDPECQALLVRLKTDLLDVFEATVAGRLSAVALDWDPRPAVCVVLAAGGYPGAIRTGDALSGLEALEDWSHGVAFHAGTRLEGDRVVTSGGRVLGVTALGNDLEGAIREAYTAIGKIRFEGMHFRSDIGARAAGRAA